MNCETSKRTYVSEFREWLRLVLVLASCMIFVCFFTVASSVGQSSSAAPQSVVTRVSAEPQSIISLAPSPKLPAEIVALRPGGAKFENAPANYHVFAAATVGEEAAVEELTLNFAGETTLTRIKSTTKDFVIESGGTCQEGDRYTRGESCSLLVRFTPQGPGHRLGFVSIAHSASSISASVGLTGNGYVPVVSFTPSLITTVPATVSGGVGIIDSATSLTVAGDVLYIGDTGNNYVREIDSTGTLDNISTDGNPPTSVAVDSFGFIYILSSSSDYFDFYTPWGGEVVFSNAYKGGSTCTPSAPCELSTVGMNDAGYINIDPNDNLFMAERTQGALEMPVAGLAGSSSAALKLWYLYDDWEYANLSPGALGVDAFDNLYSYDNYVNVYCWIIEEPEYGAAAGDPTSTRVAGAGNNGCGYSGDGGQAADAEISSSVGQIAFDIAGNLYFTDSGNQRVRRIDANTGIIRTIAGNGTVGYKGDGGAATGAELDAPTGVAVDSQGQVYILQNSATTGTAQVVRKVETTGDLTFPSTTEGVASATLIVNVANTGNNTLSFVRETISGSDPGDFSIDPNTTSCNFAAANYLYAGEDCQIGVIFKPAAVGARAATINLVDNTVNSVNRIDLSGTSVAAAAVKFTAPAATADLTSETKITLAVKVTSSYSTPTGKVTFLVDGKVVGSSSLVSGVASLGVGELASGTHQLIARYRGDKYHAAAQASETLTVQ